MKATFKVSGNMGLEIEGKDQLDLFRQISVAQDVFGNETCGICKGPARYQVRRVEKGPRAFDAYEMVCQNQACRAKLPFGVHQEGDTLFVRRYVENPDGTKNYNNGGWRKWTRAEQDTGDDNPFADVMNKPATGVGTVDGANGNGANSKVLKTVEDVYARAAEAGITEQQVQEFLWAKFQARDANALTVAQKAKLCWYFTMIHDPADYEHQLVAA